jgi:hypothetical protein
MMKKYIVETDTYCDGWVNTWTYNDETLITFDSREAAQAELDCHLHNLKADYEDGLIEDYNPEDFRITEIMEIEK